MLTIRASVGVALLALLSAFVGDVAAVPQNKGSGKKGGATAKQTPQQQAAAIPQGLSKATDGSTIMDTNVTVKYVPAPRSPTPPRLPLGPHRSAVMRIKEQAG